MMSSIMPNLNNVLKCALPIAETVLPAVINKVINGKSSNDSGTSYIPPQQPTYQQPVQVTTPAVYNNTEIEPIQSVDSDKKGVQININMNVYVINNSDDFEKLKDISFSKSYNI